MSDVKVAKLFKNGGSQAVRLPAEFRFEGDEVYATRDEDTGNVTLSMRKGPAPNVWENFIADRDAHPVSREELDEFVRIMDDVVAERRQERPVSATSRRAFWDKFFAKLDADRVEDEDLDAYMAERPMNAPIRHRNVFEDEG